MNNQLIIKTIRYNNKTCPDIVYDNPLLDKNIARELAASFVNILRVTDQKTTINTNLRHSILENIRKLCQNNAEDHFQISDAYIEMLNKFYSKQLSDLTNAQESIDHKLDMFLIRKIKDLKHSARQQTSNAEVIQALINFNKGGIYLDRLSTDIINWDSQDKKYLNILKNLWKHDDLLSKDFKDDIAIKMKGDIEKLLLQTANNLLTNSSNIDVIVTCKEVENLFKKCSASSECFQTCCGVLNYLFIMTSYDETLELFITKFVKNIKTSVINNGISVLYPLHLQCCVLLLDIDPMILVPLSQKEAYMDKCLNNLHKLHLESKSDFILLLSHFPQWFDLYFKNF